MHLKSVDIYGFKSFARETRIVLAPGLTVLVGPNGGGKSNIIDAVRWALGEQRPKELRLERWEDVLHAGSKLSRPASLAEVALTFEDGEAGVRAVARRYYRSGDTEYLIDGRSVRYKDVADLFLDSGVGRIHYAIISQGKVEAALLQKPQERLEQLEEAAGVSRYKIRRREAVSHLDESERNERRLLDLIQEVDSERDDIGAAALHERRYLELDQERRDLSARILRNHYRRDLEQTAQLEREAAQVLEGVTAAEEGLREQEDAGESLASIIEQGKTELQQKIALHDAWQQDLLRHQTTVARAAARREAILEQLGHQREMTAPLEERWQALAHEAQGTEGDASLDRRRVLDQEAERCQATLEALQQDSVRLASAQAALEAEWQGLDLERGRLSARLERASGRLALDEGTDVEQALDERRRALAHAEGRIQEETARLEAMESAAGKRDRFLLDLRQRVEDLRRHVTTQEARLQTYRQMEAEASDVAPGVRAVLRLGAEGVLGTLGSLLQVPPEIRVALGAALGGRHQDIVVEREAAARELIEYLQSHGLGRATFLPLDIVRPGHIQTEDRALNRSPGVVGWILDLLEYPPAIRAAVSHVLGRVLVAETLEQAIRVGRQHRFRYRTVTLDGQVLNAGGSVTGGSPADRSTRDVRTLDIQELERRVKAALASLQEQEQLLQGTQEEAAQDRERIAEIRSQVADWERERRQLADTLAALQETDVPGLQSAWQTVDARWQEVSQALGDVRGRMLDLDEAVRRAEGEVYAARQAVQTYDADESHRTAIAGRRQQETEHLRQQMAALERRTAEATAELERIDRELAEASLALRETQETGARLGAERTRMAEELGVRESALAEIHTRVRTLSIALRRLSGERERIDSALQRIRARWENREPVEVTEADDVSPDMLTRLESRLAEVEAELGQIGSVQPGSWALFERLGQRRSQLEGEHEDLLRARQEILATIDDLDQEMHRRRHDVADRIESSFQTACQALLGGGDGGFTWVGEHDEGIELWVRPPGKNAHPLNLLSGGEKALGALAWSFALLDANPAPFVILDEVEASLDEVNVKRFAAYLAARKTACQYILVSHHRPTMEVADVLWGVSGDGEGRSRLVSVALGEDAGPEATALGVHA